MLKALCQRIRTKIEIMAFSTTFCISRPRKVVTLVYSLCTTKFIVNYAHCTQNDHLAAEQRLEMKKGTYNYS